MSAAVSKGAKRLATLKERLAKAKREEDVKAAWAKALQLEYDTSEDIDLYTPQVLFEFKFGAALTQVSRCAQVLAQVMYYLRRLRLGHDRRAVPPMLALIDRDTVVLSAAADWRDIFSENDGRFDWDLAPSQPDTRLVATLHGHAGMRGLQVFSFGSDEPAQAALHALDRHFESQLALDFGDKKQITEDNFEDVFAYWNEVFGEAVRNGFKSSRYFVNDIQRGRTQVIASQGRVHFQVGPEEVRIKRILADDYERFWRIYDKVDDNSETLRGILAKIDRLTAEVDRRKHGEFFTPLRFASKALDYIERSLGARWWQDANVRLWDMAAGTGNLQYHLPAAAWPKVYLSTLYREDVEHCERLFPTAAVFQYDYLNDDVGSVFAGGRTATGQAMLDYSPQLTWKLPQRLRDDLADPAIRWIVLINPPFATAQQGGAAGANKADVSRTLVRDEMHAQGLGEVSRELFSQFIFRIRREFAGRQAWLGLFSKIKYLNANNDQTLRDRVLRFTFERGFMFSSVNFDGTSRSNQFPVGFLLWRLHEERALDAQTIELDVFDNLVQKTGTKRVASEHRDGYLSKWIARPPAVTVFPPFSSAITVKSSGPDLRDRISAGFLASLMCKGNDLQNQNMTALLSGPYASAGGHSVTAENFEQAMVVHAVRRLPKAQWHNDRDPFMQPTTPPSVEFVTDCVVWSLYANSNNTAALRDVEYDGRTYQIDNHLFPVPLGRVGQWRHADSDIALQLRTAQERFAAHWLAKHALSAEAMTVVAAGEAVYRECFENLNLLRTPKFKLQTWDAGWWQVRSALADRGLGAEPLAALRAAYETLRGKLAPALVEYGFLR